MKERSTKRKTLTIEKVEKAFFRLLKEKTVYEIRVREICDLAEINHSTFYLHYFDVFDLYDEMTKNAIDELNEIIDSAFDGEYGLLSRNFVKALATTYYFRSLITSKDNSSFISVIRSEIYPILDKRTDTYWLSEGREYVLIFILNGSLSVLENWIRNGCIQSPEKISFIISQICSNIDIKTQS